MGAFGTCGIKLTGKGKQTVANGFGFQPAQVSPAKVQISFIAATFLSGMFRAAGGTRG
jgi:hypothetical protein